MRIEEFERTYKLESVRTINGKDLWLEMEYTIKGTTETYRKEHCMCPECDSPDNEEGDVTDVKLIWANEYVTNEPVDISNQDLFDIAKDDYEYRHEGVAV